jgi:single-strand DNA-binding protein
MSLFGDINEVRVMGNITSDPELRFTSSGTAVVNFSVATNRRFKQGDEWKDETDFHNIVVWGNTGQQLAQRCKKGTRVMIIGRLQTRSWEGQDGRKNYRTEIVADDAFLIDRYERGKSDELPPAQATTSPARDGGAPAAAPSARGGSKKASQSASQDDIVDPDDLPF